MTKRQLSLWVAKQFYGTFYSWGGSDPSGFDCSGLIVECLKSCGILPRKSDFTAAMLAEKWPAIPVGKAGDLVYWWNSANTKVGHIEMCVGSGFAIGASGGGSNTKTREDAIKHNAFIKIRPIASRRGVWGYNSPY